MRAAVVSRAPPATHCPLRVSIGTDPGGRHFAHAKTAWHPSCRRRMPRLAAWHPSCAPASRSSNCGSRRLCSAVEGRDMPSGADDEYSLAGFFHRFLTSVFFPHSCVLSPLVLVQVEPGFHKDRLMSMNDFRSMVRRELRR